MNTPIYLASDHAGFAMKESLRRFLQDEQGYNVIDLGAHTFDSDDDYPDFVVQAAQAVANNPLHKAIILGGSGQGEAMVANRFVGVRAVVYYGAPNDPQIDAAGNEVGIITSSRLHNDANILSLGARFISDTEAKNVAMEWLTTDFESEARHARRIAKIDIVARF